ncbi:Uncharacterized protein TCM_016802 [Theobroma cacao]|uniref:Uncharacterized protein n=1 Tax=Theobroma cacao TaxID=3641 RepID=A0A061EBB0_THECC|nr:Uncharacterized protein TCM_016802 [Theobroma cacao]
MVESGIKQNGISLVEKGDGRGGNGVCEQHEVWQHIYCSTLNDSVAMFLFNNVLKKKLFELEPSSPGNCFMLSSVKCRDVRGNLNIG